MHSALERVAHRPWLLPGRHWTWRQSWRDLRFAYWPIEDVSGPALLHFSWRLDVVVWSPQAVAA